MLLRAVMVAVLVATVVGVSTTVGPTVTGMLAVFPIVLLSLMLILHPRIGGPATAAVLANSLLGMAGFSATCLFAHLVVERIGVPFGLCAGARRVGRLQPRVLGDAGGASARRRPTPRRR